MVTREVGRLDHIVAHIEGFAHPTVGVIDTVDLSVLLQGAADAARAATEALDAQIKISADENLPLLRGDAKALAQVFQHLFVNSIEAANNRKNRAQIKVRVVPRKAAAKWSASGWPSPTTAPVSRRKTWTRRSRPFSVRRRRA